VGQQSYPIDVNPGHETRDETRENEIERSSYVLLLLLAGRGCRRAVAVAVAQRHSA